MGSISPGGSIPSGNRKDYTLIGLSTNMSIPDSATTTVIWDAVISDVLNAYGGAPNPERIVVPAGFTEIRCNLHTYWALNGVGHRVLGLYKNGILINPTAEFVFKIPNALQLYYVNVDSSWVVANPGDIITAKVSQDSGAALNLNGSNETWFQVEFR